MTTQSFSASSPVTRRVRAYFAPVERQTSAPVFFDAAQQGGFDLDAPPSPWIDLGWIEGFARKSSSKSEAIVTGIPPAAQSQVRTALQATVSFHFLSWTKLTMALATGSQHMNLLAAGGGSSEGPDGAQAAPAVPIQGGSTATSIVLTANDAGRFHSGSWIAVDADYAGQTGFVGLPVSGAYLRTAVSDMDYVRRITFNVGLVTRVNGNVLLLSRPLLGGVPAAGTKAQAITGFVDREGGSFYQEWSALFVMEGTQGERMYLHYPRLQPSSGAAEDFEALGSKRKGAWQRMLLRAEFLAMAVTDPLDGERVLCSRSFMPAPYAVI
jgi:hypothetical protein